MNKEHQYTFRRSLAHVMKAELTLPPETSPEKAATNVERATIDKIFRNGLTWASTYVRCVLKINNIDRVFGLLCKNVNSPLTKTCFHGTRVRLF